MAKAKNTPSRPLENVQAGEYLWDNKKERLTKVRDNDEGERYPIVTGNFDSCTWDGHEEEGVQDKEPRFSIQSPEQLATLNADQLADIDAPVSNEEAAAEAPQPITGPLSGVKAGDLLWDMDKNEMVRCTSVRLEEADPYRAIFCNDGCSCDLGGFVSCFARDADDPSYRLPTEEEIKAYDEELAEAKRQSSGIPPIAQKNPDTVERIIRILQEAVNKSEPQKPTFHKCTFNIEVNLHA